MTGPLTLAIAASSTAYGIDVPGGWWLLGGIGGCVVAAAFGKGFLTGGDKHAKRAATLRDQSSAWAGLRDVEDLVVNHPDPARVQLGRVGPKLLANPARRSVMVIAPTGAGKTPIVVVPSVLRHAGPALVASVKSDVHRLTRHHRASKGPVWLFDPAGSSGQPTCKWSPLAVIRNYAGAMKAAAWLSDSSKVSGVENEGYWDALGQKLLAPMLFAAAKAGYHMADVSQWVDYADEDGVDQLLEHLRVKILEQAGVDHTSVGGDVRTLLNADAAAEYADALLAQAHWAATRSRHEKTKSSVFGTAEVILKGWAHPEVRDAVAADPESPDTFWVDRLLDQAGTLYLVAPASDQELFTPIFETLTNAILREVEQRAARTGLPLNPPLLLMLDEAANIAPLRRLDQVASKGANEGVVLVSVWQDEAQQDVVYGDTRARVVRSNHTAKIYLPGITDDRTLEGLSQAIGDHPVERRSHSVDSYGQVSRSISVADERLAPPSWLRTLPKGVAIVITGSHKPIRVTVRGWYQDDHLRALVDPAVAAEFDALFTSSNDARPRRPMRLKSQASDHKVGVQDR